MAGWWKCTNYTGTNICHSEGVRYYVDCNRQAGAHCPHGCSCANGLLEPVDVLQRVPVRPVQHAGGADDRGRLPGDQVREPVHAVPDICSCTTFVDNNTCGHDVAVPEDRPGAGVAVHGLRGGGGGRVRMTALVVVETMLLVLLAVLVVGLLRSHAEILRRLESRRRAAAIAPPRRWRSPSRGTTRPRRPTSAASRSAATRCRSRSARRERATLLAFLTSGCCGLRRLLGGAARASGGDRAGRRPGRGRHPRLEHGEPQPAARAGAAPACR